MPDANVADDITIDLAATATALAANGGDCGAGNYPLGVDASGAVESCTADVDTDFTSTTTHEQIPFERSTAVVGTDSLIWDGSAKRLDITGSVGATLLDTGGLDHNDFGIQYSSGQMLGVSATITRAISGGDIWLGIDAGGGGTTDALWIFANDTERVAQDDLWMFRHDGLLRMFYEVDDTKYTDFLVDATGNLAITPVGGNVAIPGASSGANGAYDLSIGDVTTPDYGALAIGQVGIYTSSFAASGLDLDKAMLFRQEAAIGAGNDPGIEFAWMEGGNTVRMLIPESGAGNAMNVFRSLQVGGAYSAVTGNNHVLCDTQTTYDSNIDCDAGGTGADLFVQDDIELEGEIFSSGTIHLDADDANQLTISATSQTASHAFDFPDDEIVSGDIIEGDGAGSFTYTAKSAVALSGFNDDLTHLTGADALAALQENGANELAGEAIGTACSENEILKANATGGLDCAADAIGGSPSFDLITTGTNSTGTLTLAAGSALILEDAAGAAPTADGQIQFDRTSENLEVGNGATTNEYVPSANVSGDASMTTAGAVTVADNSHDHTQANISDLDHLTEAEARTGLIENGSDEMTIETLGTACSDGQLVEADATGGIVCVTTGGDVTGPADALVVGNDSHDHTEAFVTDLDHLTETEARTGLIENGSAEMTIETLGTACSDGQLVEADATGGIVCVTTGGDITGPADALVVANDSHNHTETFVTDLDHLTEAEARTGLIENGTAEMTGETLGTACSDGEVLKANASGGIDCGTDETGGTPAFSSIATGTNSTATMTLASGSSFVLEDANGAAPTADGQIKFDRTTERLEVGDGGATNEFYAGAHLTGADALAALQENGANELTGEAIGTACSEDEILKANASGGLDCAADETGGTPAFSSIATGTNSTATMTLASGSSFILEDANGAAPTTDGQIKFDRTTERLEVGDGGATNEFYAGAHLTGADALAALQENGANELAGEELGTACSDGEVLKANASGGIDCGTDATGGTPGFDNITTGTNSTATMTLAAGSALILEDAAGAAPTADGQIQFDRTSENIEVGNGATTNEYVPSANVSGDASMTTAGVVTVADDLHDHVITNIDAFTIADLQTQTTGTSTFYTEDTVVPIWDGGTGVGVLQDGGMLIGSGTGAITALGVATNGQILVGSTAADPVVATLNADRSLTATVGAGTLEIDADAELYTHTSNVVIVSPDDYTNGFVQIDLGAGAVTITQIVCSTNTGTADLMPDERDEETPQTTGTNVLSSVLQCTSTPETDTCAELDGCADNFANAAIAAGNIVSIDIDATSGTPGVLRIAIEYTKDD